MHGDAISTARVLYSVRKARRHWVLARMMREADAADARRLSGLPAHPAWGDGRLMTAALRRHPPKEPSLGDHEYCHCLAMVFAALAEHGHDPAQIG